MRTAMGKSAADVRLQVWTPLGAEVLFVKQVSPDLQDLTETRQVVNPLTGDYPLGSWGNESRDYHVSVMVRPGGVGDEMLAARLKVMVDGESAGQALVRATWTDDTELSTRINRQVAHYTGQQELAELIQDGLEARKSGDEDTAIVKLGKAVAIASESGNTDMAGLLANVVDVDEATGRVKLKRAVSEADEMTLETRSTRTARVRK
jgi:von Willebrand factor type A C-terminal domain